MRSCLRSGASRGNSHDELFRVHRSIVRLVLIVLDKSDSKPDHHLSMLLWVRLNGIVDSI